MNKYLLAAKGQSLFLRIVKRLCPHKFEKYLINSYTKEQILTNLCAIGQDRCNEDMLAVWKYILEKKDDE